MNESCKRAGDYMAYLKAYLANINHMYRSCRGEGTDRALKLQSDPRAQVLTGLEKRIADLKDVEKLALEIDALLAKMISDNLSQLTSIQDDNQYLGRLKTNLESVGTALQAQQLRELVHIM